MCRFLAVACVLLALQPVAGQISTGPFAYMIENHAVDAGVKEDLASLFLQFALTPEDGQFPTGISPMFSALQQDPPQRLTNGKAVFAGPNGTMRSCRVVSGVSEVGFRRLVELEKQTRPIVVTDEGTKVTLGASPKSENGINWTYEDISYRYNDGIVLWGDEFIFNVSIPKLKPIIARASGWHSGMIVDTKSASQMLRDQLFTTYAVGWGTQMQQRDGEPTVQFQARASLYGIYTECLRRFLMDVQKFDLLIKYPRRDQPYQLKFTASFDPESEAARTMSSMQVHRQLGHRSCQSSSVKGTLDMRLPDSVANLVNANAKRFFLPLTESSSFRDASSQNILSVHACLRDGEHSQGAAVASLYTGTSETASDPKFHEGSLILENQVAQQPVFWAGQQREQFFEMTIASHKESAEVLDEIPPRASKAITMPFFQIQADVNALSEIWGREAVYRLFDFAETELLRRKLLESPDYRMLIERGKRDIPRLDSLTELIPSEGDWKFQSSARATRNGSTLRFNLTAGRDLFGILAAVKMRARRISGSFLKMEP